MGTQLSPDRIPVMGYINFFHRFSGGQGCFKVVQKTEVGLMTNYKIKNAGAKKSANVLWEDITMGLPACQLSILCMIHKHKGLANQNKTIPNLQIGTFQPGFLTFFSCNL